MSTSESLVHLADELGFDRDVAKVAYAQLMQQDEFMKPEGERLKAARDALQEATNAARIAAVSAMRGGMTESEAARQYGVTRMTIRAWKSLKEQPPKTTQM